MKLGGMLVQQRVPTSEEWAILKRLTATCSHYIFQNMQNQRSFSPQVFIQMLPKSTQMVEIKCPEWHSDRRQWQFMHAISDKHLNARGSIKERILFKLVLIRNHLFIFFTVQPKPDAAAVQTIYFLKECGYFLALLCKYESVR